MKKLFCIAATIAGAMSHASFELVMVADSTFNGVHRFDGITGAYLGNFGGGVMVSVKGLAIDQNSQTAYVLEGTGNVVSAWNYNTGAYLRTHVLESAVNGIGAYADGTFATFSSTSFRRYNSSGTVIGNWQAPAGFTWRGAASNMLYGGHGMNCDNVATGETRTYNVSGANTLAGYYWSTVTPGFATSGVSTEGNKVCVTYFASFVSFQNKSTGSLFGTSVGLNDVRGVTQGHGSMAYVCGRSTSDSTLGVIHRFDSNSGFFRGEFGAGMMGVPVGIASVVAPEPGTMLALGLGVAALARRRRR